jgi:hypothetical protein
MHVCVGWCVKWNSLWRYTTLPSYNFTEWMISMIITVRLWRLSNIVQIRPDLSICVFINFSYSSPNTFFQYRAKKYKIFSYLLQHLPESLTKGTSVILILLGVSDLPIRNCKYKFIAEYFEATNAHWIK